MFSLVYIFYGPLEVQVGGSWLYSWTQFKFVIGRIAYKHSLRRVVIKVAHSMSTYTLHFLSMDSFVNKHRPNAFKHFPSMKSVWRLFFCSFGRPGHALIVKQGARGKTTGHCNQFVLTYIPPYGDICNNKKSQYWHRLTTVAAERYRISFAVSMTTTTTHPPTP